MSDLISRQAAIDAIDEISNEVDDGDGFDYEKWREYFCELPSALGTNLAEVGTDLISRKAVIDALHTWFRDGFDEDKWWNSTHVLAAIEGIPSAEPERIRGKWIYHIDDLFPAESTMECNQCHAEQPLICDDEFCPKCGAKMEGTE